MKNCEFNFLTNSDVDIVAFINNPRKRNVTIVKEFIMGKNEDNQNNQNTEDVYYYPTDPERILFKISSQRNESIVFKAPNKYEADSWVNALKTHIVKNQIKIKSKITELEIIN